MQLKDYEQVESSSIDFKEKVEYTKPKSWLKSVSAFANSNGGILLFGVKDIDRIPIGLSNIEKDSEKVSELINNRITPIPRYELKTFTEDEKDFMEIKVGDGPRTPYYYAADGRKEAFIRAGNESIPAPKHILDNLILKGQNTTFDELPSMHETSDVSFTLLNASLKRETGKELNKDKDLQSLELITSENKVTNAGLLLSDQGLLTQSRIFCTRWKGLVKGSISGDAIDDKEYTGSIISLLENAEAFIKNNSKIGWEIQGMKRVEIEDYPIRAIREAIVNAIIHRDYQIIGSEIHIDMYDNRLEITSPGGMLDGSFVQNLDITKISSMRRNRVISDIFNRLHFMERRGSGLTRIIESYNNCSIKPNFTSDISSFKVTFPNKGYIEDNKNKEEPSKMAVGNLVTDEDYFMIKMYKNIPNSVKKNTYNQIQQLFKKFTYTSDFKREDIEENFNVKKSRASEIISMMLESDLIEPSDPTKYRFKK